MFRRRPQADKALQERLRKLGQPDGPVVPRGYEPPAAPPAPVLRRQNNREPRQPVYKDGVLVFGDGHRLRVIIKDLSASGARVEFFVHTTLPDSVTLVEPTMRLRRLARVAWQGNGVAGLAFAASS